MSAVPHQTPAPQTGGRPKQKTMSIGVVLKQLRVEFPEITVSKIRFLEAEGLVSPQRSATGYRRFTSDDVARLRYILITQRDHYLPLKVIRQQLEAIDAGEIANILQAQEAKPIVAPESFRTAQEDRLTDQELAHRSQSSLELVRELLEAGLLYPDSAGLFSTDDVTIVSTVKALDGFGLDLRHLRSIRQAARRQSDMIQQVVAPVSRAKRDDAQARGEELSQQLSALMVSLHAALIKTEMRRSS